MSLYLIHNENCRACYKCVRSCPVSAIRVRGGKVSIETDRCIHCGICQGACGNGAIRTTDDVGKTKALIAQGRPVYLLMNPAILGFFKVSSLEQLCAAARALGFAGAACSAEGAAAAFGEYMKLAKRGRMKNIILTTCPTVVSLIEKYYEDLADQLAPVASPMIAGGRLVKARAEGAAVVFCGSCLAAHDEADDVRHSTEIDGVISFTELHNWFSERGIDPGDCAEAPLLGSDGGKLNIYPFPGGMSRCLGESGQGGSYHPVYVNGIENCVAVCEELKKGSLKGCFVEMYACDGGCVGGSYQLKRLTGKMETCLILQSYAAERYQVPKITDKGVYFKRPVIARPVQELRFDEVEIGQVMKDMGLDEAMDCGACGYGTCRERAVAVLRGEAEADTCIAVLRRRAERVSNFALDAMPLIAIIVDQQQRIVEFNQAAARAFGISRDEALKKYIFDIMDPQDFQYVLSVKLGIKNKKLVLPEYGLTLSENMAYMRAQDVALGLFTDISAEQRQLQKRKKQAEHNMEMAQRVIDKQMNVAQQIASLLGETTAETKLTLDRLKNQLGRDGEE